MKLAVALPFDGGLIYRNVRPLSMILEEFDARNIAYVHVDSGKMQYGCWDVVLVFRNNDLREKYAAGEIEYTAAWKPGVRTEKQRVNPLKAAKRAARGK